MGLLNSFSGGDTSGSFHAPGPFSGISNRKGLVSPETNGREGDGCRHQLKCPRQADNPPSGAEPSTPTTFAVPNPRRMSHMTAAMRRSAQFLQGLPIVPRRTCKASQFFGCSGVDLNIAQEVDVATVKKFGKASLVPIAGNEENGHEDAIADPGTNSCQG